MPEAFCGIETVRKWVLLNLWVLWEKNSAASCLCVISSSGCVLFLTDLHRRTEHTAFHRGLAAGRYHRTLQPSLAVTLCDLCMPEAFCGLETVRLKPPWTPCALWEKELPSDSHASHLIASVRSISHRFTQKNGTHKAPQRH